MRPIQCTYGIMTEPVELNAHCNALLPPFTEFSRTLRSIAATVAPHGHSSFVAIATLLVRLPLLLLQRLCAVLMELWHNMRVGSVLEIAAEITSHIVQEF